MKEASKISYEELKAWLVAKKKFVLVEVLTADNYESGHIPGAINIPAEQIETANQKLKKNDMIVVYCNGVNCPLASRCALYLLEHDFKNVLYYHGGKPEWLEKGNQLETADGQSGTCKDKSCNPV